MKHWMPALVIFAITMGVRAQDNPAGTGNAKIPADIQAELAKPIYKTATWGLRVVDLGTGETVIDVGANHKFFIGSVRKIFTVGELLNEVGAAHRYNTPVYRHGDIDGAGVLHGDLILVAAGDLTMGGRTNPDGTIALTDFDHNEADTLGNAQLTKPDPLAGYADLARQVANAGVRRVAGDVIVDDRLFQPFNFRGEFNLKPIFVNDDVVDLIVNPTVPECPASVTWRPVSAALGVDNDLTTGIPGSIDTLKLNPEFPQCIGQPGCSAEIAGELPVDFVPPLTNKFPLVQTFRIVNPTNYTRTVFIEALRSAGAKVNAATVAENPVQLLPSDKSYSAATKLAELTGLPYSEDAKLILKVSYNIGADTSLLLWGLTQRVNNMNDALLLEKQNLSSNFGIPEEEFHFADGSGGGATTATNRAVTRMLTDMTKLPVFPAFFNALPILGVDGSLGFVTDFQSDPTLAGAKGHVHAKTGTFVASSAAGLVVQGQAFGGYITTKRGRKLAFELVVNHVPLTGLTDLLGVFQDEGRISSILWRDN